MTFEWVKLLTHMLGFIAVTMLLSRGLRWLSDRVGAEPAEPHQYELPGIERAVVRPGPDLLDD